MIKDNWINIHGLDLLDKITESTKELHSEGSENEEEQIEKEAQVSNLG